MRILLALPCCCSCRQAMATELKKQKPLGRGERGAASPFPSVSPPLQPPVPRDPGQASPQTAPGKKGMSPISPYPGLPQALHGCGMVRMVSWGPNHSKTILETKNAYQPNSQPSDPHLQEPAPSPRLLPREGAMGQQLTAARMHLKCPRTQAPGSIRCFEAGREPPPWCVPAVSTL